MAISCSILAPPALPKTFWVRVWAGVWRLQSPVAVPTLTPCPLSRKRAYPHPHLSFRDASMRRRGVAGLKTLKFTCFNFGGFVAKMNTHSQIFHRQSRPIRPLQVRPLSRLPHCNAVRKDVGTGMPVGEGLGRGNCEMYDLFRQPLRYVSNQRVQLGQIHRVLLRQSCKLKHAKGSRHDRRAAYP